MSAVKPRLVSQMKKNEPVVSVLEVGGYNMPNAD